MKYVLYSLALCCICFFTYCSNHDLASSKPPPPEDTVVGKMDVWLTKADQSVLLQKQTAIPITTGSNNSATVEIDTSQQYQQMDGFGYTLTGGSAVVINQMNSNEKGVLLAELFGTNENSIGISYLRISIGASDLDSVVFSYDDMPAGQTDPGLINFTLNSSKQDLIPLFKSILLINPKIKILACPWSPPVWMKDNGSSKGGSLNPAYYDAYAQYFVKYIQGMKAEGITIDAITPQNEPLNPDNNPSLLMQSADEAIFIKNHLGPAFSNAGITTKIIVYDHNCDRPDYPLSILNDAAAKSFVDGSAFHMYAGDISALSTVHAAHPDKNVYFTEQYTASNGDFSGDLIWHIKNLVIGAPRNWSRTVLEWNLANDASFGPHTPGGCTTCKGAVTLSGALITRNVAYYIIAHASKFVPAGSVRLKSNVLTNLSNVAYKRPDGKKVLIVLNEGTAAATFNIRVGNNLAAATMPASSVATFVW